MPARRSVLLAVLLGGAWFSIIGAFLAVPVAASIAVVLRYLGDLIDLRTGERTAVDIDWATDDGASVGWEWEKAAVFFRALVRRNRSDEQVALATGQDPELGDIGKATLRERLRRRVRRSHD